MASDQSSTESGAVEFQGKSLDLHDGHAVLYRGVFCPALCRQLFAVLFRETAWQQHVVALFGRSMPAPRLSAWHGDAGACYRYSGQTLEPVPWTDTLQAIRCRAESVAATRFNSVLINLYRSGQDGVGWHSDNEPGLGSDPVIASVSLGALRWFDLRHKGRGTRLSVELDAGSVLVMRGATQANWSHRVPKTKRTVGPRINLTFRWIYGRERA